MNNLIKMLVLPLVLFACNSLCFANEYIILSGSLSDLFYHKKSYIEEFGESKIHAASLIYPEFKKASKLRLAPEKHINVLVTSANDLKIKAAKDIFTQKLNANKRQLNVKGYNAASDISEQPIGLEEAIKGAKNRIDNLKKNHAFNNENPTYLVSIENFFTELRDDRNPTDHALVIIEEPSGVQHLYLSDGVEIATDIYKAALQHENMTIGQVLEQKYKINAKNWHSYVTANKISRLEQIISAI